VTLPELAAGGPEVPLALIGADEALTRQVQARLAAHGVLDPPVRRQQQLPLRRDRAARRRRAGLTTRTPA
jgi:hypothetical protein